MAKMKIYVVQEYRIHDYETIWHDTHAYRFESNALKKLQDIKEQDMMPIVEEESFEVHCDTPRRFEAGREGDYWNKSVCVKIIETVIEDYHLSD